MARVQAKTSARRWVPATKLEHRSFLVPRKRRTKCPRLKLRTSRPFSGPHPLDRGLDGVNSLGFRSGGFGGAHFRRRLLVADLDQVQRLAHGPKLAFRGVELAIDL